MISRLFTFALALLLLAPSIASAVSPDETDAAVIMKAADDRDEPDKVTARMILVVIDSADRKRQRTVQTRSIQFKEGTKQLLLFESPADVRNTGLLSIDYDDGGKDDDQWLYLPNLRKSTRISSGDKSGSFMGTDLSYSDMTRSDPAEYDYKVVKQSVEVDGEDCWLIESRARTKKLKEETGYVKSQVWVSKGKLMPMRVKHWIAEGKKIKLIKFSDLKQIDGLWVAHKIAAQTRQNKKTLSKTLIVFKDYKTNQKDVSDEDFNQRRLEKGL